MAKRKQQAEETEPSQAEQLGVNLQPGQELVEEEPGRWVIRMQNVVAPRETWPDPTAESTAQPAKPQHPPIHKLSSHQQVVIVEVLDMGGNTAHIRAIVGSAAGKVEITAGCGLDQIMDRRPADREAWCRQVVWDHYSDTLGSKPSRVDLTK